MMLFRDLDISPTESVALLEFLVQSNKISCEEIQSSLACIRETTTKKRSNNDIDNNNTQEDQLLDNNNNNNNGKCSRISANSTTQADTNKKADTLIQSRYRHVAIRIAYDGSTYNGFAENCGSNEDNSIEKQLFAALVKTCLVKDNRSTCHYSRCGRTDRGVSAFGQVIALHIRSRIPKVDGRGEELEEEHLPRNSNETISVWKKNNNQQQDITEMDFCRILNGVLPDTIRAIGWTPVSNEFSARFSASDRTYRYFFVRKHYNLNAMQCALDKLVGTHDFRNLCKMDTEAVSNFQRCIKYAKVLVIHPNTNNNEDRRQMCYFEICGQAFLWHMIRCIVSICFMVGRGDEDPCVVENLLDVGGACPAKPSYPMAPDLPLVLHSCSYGNLTFGHSSTNLWELTNTLERQWEEAAIATERIRNAIESLQQEAYVQYDDFWVFLRQQQQQQKRHSRKNTTTDEIEVLTDEVVLQTLHKVQSQSQEKQQRQDKQQPEKSDTVTLEESSMMKCLDTTAILADGVVVAANYSTTSNIISWKHALSTIYELGFSLPSLVPTNGSTKKQPRHVKLMERSKGTTYQEKISSMKGKKRERYEMNMLKKEQSTDDNGFYERMTKHGGSGI